jgi:hypothetical protein
MLKKKVYYTTDIYIGKKWCCDGREVSYFSAGFPASYRNKYKFLSFLTKVSIRQVDYVKKQKYSEESKP